ncbi:glycosyltransferase [Muricauda sp. CAU 1633]|uniref:glycosyltransferase n=1 Tax=Allomuricauda sp. CAU 1633 TaxID=2816036 RepID=UPI001A8F5BDF|nr:glycosyltransferase [Muricauda sp. CAU 1633]MBO0320975.1 glycosyltransferase [Muricauda sp. CAU 1633]
MGETVRKKLVISAVNFDSGGPLSILNDCLSFLSDKYGNNLEVIALVHSKALIKADGIKLMEFPKSKRSWFNRMYYEFFYFNKLSKTIKPDFWLSLHDISPRVDCKIQFVYCHNPTPFYKTSIKDFFVNPKVYLFSKFYKHLYRLNIKSNKYIIVQQDWIRKEFFRFWGLKNIVVAYPNTPTIERNQDFIEGEKKILFYPSFPRPFKNFEILCEAISLLPEDLQGKCELRITIDKNLNPYAKKIVQKYGNIKAITFLGLLTREQVFEEYAKASCLVFPSKLETWGLPITEFKDFNKPILLANLPYARETLGNYDSVKFFDPYNAKELSNIISRYLRNDDIFGSKVADTVAFPFCIGWNELFKFLLNGEEQ